MIEKTLRFLLGRVVIIDDQINFAMVDYLFQPSYLEEAFEVYNTPFYPDDVEKIIIEQDEITIKLKPRLQRE